MFSNTQTMTSRFRDYKVCQIVGTTFSPRQKKLTPFSVIAIKPADFVFEQTIDKIKGVNKTYVIP